MMKKPIKAKTLALAMFTMLITNVANIQATATPSGTHLGYVLNTNIRVFIDDAQIMGYNIDGWTYVVAEDLIAYGFTVIRIPKRKIVWVFLF